MTKVISIRIKPYRETFMATIIGPPQPGVSTSAAMLTQRFGDTEYAAASAALHALLVEGEDAPEGIVLAAVLRDLLEGAELIDDPNGNYGYLVSPEIIRLLKEAIL